MNRTRSIRFARTLACVALLACPAQAQNLPVEGLAEPVRSLAGDRAQASFRVVRPLDALPRLAGEPRESDPEPALLLLVTLGLGGLACDPERRSRLAREAGVR